MKINLSRKELYRYMQKPIRYFQIILLFFMISCSPTRRIGEGEYLLTKTRIRLDSGDIDVNDMKRYQKQTPNKKILGLRFHLFLYNLASPSKDKFPSSWLRKIGEEPVIWEAVQTRNTDFQYKKYLETKGYYQAEVKDSLILRKKKAVVVYTAILHEPYIVRNIKYSFEDESISSLVLHDTLNRLIKPGMLFDKDVLQNERSRLETWLKNKGYYNFKKEYIVYKAVETEIPNRVDLLVTILEDADGTPDPVSKVRKHHQFKLDKLFIYPDQSNVNDQKELKDSRQFDTVLYRDMNLLYSGKHKIKPAALVGPNICQPGNLYSLNNVKRTYNNYLSLGMFKMVNIGFKEHAIPVPDTGQFRYIDCYIWLLPRKIQSYQVEILGTNSAGDLGVRANIIYNNYNLLRGAENLQHKITAAIEAVDKRYGTNSPVNLAPMTEIGAESSLSLPRFVIPFRDQSFIRKFSPKTLINISYNYQSQPRYTRTIAGVSLGYQWRGNSFNKHYLSPLEFNYVWLPRIDDAFWDTIKNTTLANSYISHTILESKYQFEFTNQVLEKLSDYVYLKINLESAGLFSYSLAKALSLSGDSKFYNDSILLSAPYFKFLKGDIDFRLYHQITSDNLLAYRVFAGIGYPYLGSTSLPFEKMYFAGGPNGIRAWNTSTLGPGSDTTTGSYGNKLGDLKLEANVEYRFKLFWKMEGALFLDAGNIWMTKAEGSRSEAVFKWDGFIDDIAVGTGFGLRFDFSFLLIRTDFGYKLRDPAIMEGNKWILHDKYPKKLNRWSFQFGIGYPF